MLLLSARDISRMKLVSNNKFYLELIVKQVCARLNQIGEDRLLWKYLVLTTFPYAFGAKPEKDNWKALFKIGRVHV